jgi:hypothetical protein
MRPTAARSLGKELMYGYGRDTPPSILAGTFVWWLYLHYPQFGVANKANMFEWVLGVVVAALIFYYLVRWILRARRGVKFELVYAEISPE